MRSPTYLFACMLGLLASLSVALQPIFSTETEPFSLRAGTIERFNVTLKFNKKLQAFVPVLTLAPSKANAFILTDGNLTTPDRKLAAFYGNVPDPFALPLLPLLFGRIVKKLPFDDTADFFVEPAFSPSKGFRPQLFSINGGKVPNI